MQHLGVNFGGIWRFKLGFFICFFCNYSLRKSGLIFKRPVTTLPHSPPKAYAMEVSNWRYGVFWRAKTTITQLRFGETAVFTRILTLIIGLKSITVFD